MYGYTQGVGFSFTNDPKGYENITDAQSSHDNFQFLLAWFEVFAQFKSNDFYITAGTRIPSAHPRTEHTVVFVRRSRAALHCHLVDLTLYTRAPTLHHRVVRRPLWPDARRAAHRQPERHQHERSADWEPGNQF